MTYYATPVTPSDFANLIALITWPQDCNLQKAAMDRCLDVLSALKRGWAAMQPVRLYVGSDTPPGLADWQAAWVDLGYSLPISGSVIGIWETLTDTIKDGGQYAWIENDMRPTLAKWWNGSSEFILTTPSMYSNSANITTSEAAYITEPVTLDRAAYIEAAWGLVIGFGATGYMLWRNSYDAVNSVHGFIAQPAGGLDDPYIRIIRQYSTTKITSSSIVVYMRKVGAVTVPVYMTNTSVTRKVESGIWYGTSFITLLGEISALSTEAVYLA